MPKVWFGRDLVVLDGLYKQLFLRSKEAIFWLVVFPTILFLILTSIFGNVEQNVTVKVAIIGESEILERAFSGIQQISPKFFPYSKKEKIKEYLKALERETFDVLVVLPEGFDAIYSRALLLRRTKFFKPVTVEVHYIPVRDGSKLAFEMVRGILDTLDVQDRVEMVIHNLSTRRVDYNNFIFPGVVGMAWLSVYLFGFMNDMLWLNRRKMIKRLSVSPFNLLKIYLFVAIVNLTSLVLGISILTFVAWLKGVDVVSYLPSLIFNSLISALVLTFLTLAVLVFENRSSAIVAFEQIFFQVQMFAGGFYFPLKQIPSFVQVVARFLPITYTVDSVRKVMGLNSIANNHYLVPLVYLLISISVVITGMKKFHKFEG
uniref:ABC transporter permease n=1 Tax=Fervidobacterium thailandense TaxID=1008305 RepID=A0A7C4GM67_9BACT